MKASRTPLTDAGGVQTRLSPAAIDVVPAVTAVPFFVSVPPRIDSMRKEIGSMAQPFAMAVIVLFGSVAPAAAASVAGYMPVVLWRAAGLEGVEIATYRSFAGSLWHMVERAAEPFGFHITE